MITVLHEQRTTPLPNALADGEALWLGREDIERATGWTWKPQGLCHGDVCVPLPGGAAADGIARADSLDIAALWRRMGHPVVHDETGSAWVLGSGSAQRADTLATLEAPDFSLPDINGQPHRLSDYRGKKVFLATWASW